LNKKAVWLAAAVSVMAALFLLLLLLTAAIYIFTQQTRPRTITAELVRNYYRR
jgi:hypothetical protein